MGGCSGKPNQAIGVRKRGMFMLDKTPIGKGEFLKVYKGKSTYEEGLQVAVKALNKQFLSEDDMQKVKDEVDKL